MKCKECTGHNRFEYEIFLLEVAWLGNLQSSSGKDYR